MVDPELPPAVAGRMWPPFRSVLFRIASRTAIRSRTHAAVLEDHGHDIDLRIGLDERLDHALAKRPVAEQGRRHDVPAPRLRDVPGGDLAAGEGPDGKVVQRALAGVGF